MSEPTHSADNGTLAPASAMPIRQRSANGEPKPGTSIERTCRRCGASLLGLAPGKTGERGIWSAWQWFCSQECFDDRSDSIVRHRRGPKA